MLAADTSLSTNEAIEPDYHIRFEYHPASKQPPHIYSSYQQSLSANTEPVDSELPSKPYSPFTTQADFDFAEFVTEHRLSSSAIDDLLKRLHTVWANNVLVTMETAAELEQFVKDSIEPTVEVNLLIICLGKRATKSSASLRRLVFSHPIKVLVETPSPRNIRFLCARFGTGWQVRSRIRFCSLTFNGTLFENITYLRIDISNL